MITRIQLKNPHIKSLEKTFNLKRINVLVGTNGSGKTTFINMLKTQQIKGLDKDTKAPVEFLYKDFAEDMKSSGDKYSNNGVKYMECVLSHFQSSGEHSFDFYIKELDGIKDKLILMDEPERGLDLFNVRLLAKHIKKNTSCQFIIATHSLYLIELLGVVHMIELSESYIKIINESLNKKDR